MTRATTPIVVLCGGRAVRLAGPDPVAKALVPIGGRPMVAHVLERYAIAGFRRFILAVGRQADRYGALAGDVELRGARCRIDVVDTGIDTATADRVVAVADRLDEAHFGVHYSDVLSTVDIGEVADAHLAHGRLATLLGARVPTRFRILGLRQGETLVRGFAIRPVILNDRINGGYYFFRREALPRFGGVLEEGVLEGLAADGQLDSVPFDGTWCYLDAERHLADLERLVSTW